MDLGLGVGNLNSSIKILHSTFMDDGASNTGIEASSSVSRDLGASASVGNLGMGTEVMGLDRSGLEHQRLGPEHRNQRWSFHT